jgi:hypothetical protein
MSKYDLPPNLKGPAARRTARAALGERMAARTGNEPAPTPPPFSEYSRAGAVPEPPAISGPRNYHVPSEAPTKRQRADLSPGMRARLIEMIGRARAAFAESRAAGDRRQSLIQDLMAARQQLKDAEDGEARRSWLQRKGNPDQAGQGPGGRLGAGDDSAERRAPARVCVAIHGRAHCQASPREARAGDATRLGGGRRRFGHD